MNLPNRPIFALAVALLATGCAVGPDYTLPTSASSATFKELPPGWAVAAPADTLERGPWWTLFSDPQLDQLEQQVDSANQTVAALVAAYAGARAMVSEQRAALFPSLSLNGNVTRTGGSGSNAQGAGTNHQVGLAASWAPDVWGRLGRAVEGATASAQASAGDLASGRLSAQGELATDYFSLRQSDAQIALLKDTVVAYQRTVDITQNRYKAGVAPKTDLLQAQTQLYSAQAQQVALMRTRAQLEHAIAVLTGQAPANFTLAPVAWKTVLPAIPVGVPSTLLQRRPDIAADERRVAAANAQIGVAKAAYYPSLNLSAGLSSSVWSLGLAAAETLFDGGATKARVSEAESARAQAVAHYRQTVLTAFQDVEDQLTATTVLEQQEKLQRSASAAADLAEVQVLNRYRAGQDSFTDVATAQAAALSARSALVQAQAARQTTAVALIQALGGGWHADTK